MKFKKIVSVAAAIAMLSGASGIVADAAPTATTFNSVIHLNGTSVENKNTTVAVAVVKADSQNPTKNDIAYFGDVKVGSDGNYSVTFPCDKAINLTDYEVKLGTSETAAVTEASQKLTVTFKNMKNEEMTVAGMAAQIENLYDIDLTGYKLIAASYKGDELENVAFADASDGFGGGKIGVTADTETLKCFLWNEMTPITMQNSKTKTAYADTANKINTKINCWGDSLTYGANGEGTTYPGIIQSFVGNSVQVNNYGVGGEGTREIAGRQGGAPFVLLTDVTIPADTTAVAIELNEGKILVQGGNTNYSIDGIEGTLTKVADAPKAYWFTRTTSGDAKSVAKGTEVLPVGVDCSGINIIWTGANDKSALKKDFAGTKGKIFELHSKMISKIQNEGGDYIVIGIADGANAYAAEDEELAEYQAAEYGDRFLDLRKILTEEKTYDKYEITLSDTGKTGLAKGCVPSDIISSDGLHFNKTGYDLIGKIIYAKLMSMGMTM